MSDFNYDRNLDEFIQDNYDGMEEKAILQNLFIFCPRYFENNLLGLIKKFPDENNFIIYCLLPQSKECMEIFLNSEVLLEYFSPYDLLDFCEQNIELIDNILNDETAISWLRSSYFNSYNIAMILEFFLYYNFRKYFKIFFSIICDIFSPATIADICIRNGYPYEVYTCKNIQTSLDKNSLSKFFCCMTEELFFQGYFYENIGTILLKYTNEKDCIGVYFILKDNDSLIPALGRNAVSRKNFLKWISRCGDPKNIITILLRNPIYGRRYAYEFLSMQDDLWIEDEKRIIDKISNTLKNSE